MTGKKGQLLGEWIWFNCDSYYIEDLSKLDLYQTLTHEVYHTISRKGEITALANDNIGKGVALNEIINEMAASRTTYLRSKTDDDNFRQETSGYDLITFVANLLSASFGIEERELLKGGLQNRRELKNVYRKYISKGDYQNEVLSHCQILETNLDFLYNALYVEEENQNDSEIIVSSLKEICFQIFDIASIRISKSSRKINSEYAEELAYQFQKNKEVIENSLLKLRDRNKITASTMIETVQKIYSSEEYLNFLDKVSDILVLTNQKSKITDKSVWQEMERLAKDGELINHAEEFGIEAGKNPTTRYKIIKYHKKTNHEFDNPTQWDNEYVIEIMERLWNEREVVDVAKLEQELDTITIAQKIKDFITQFKNRNLLKLEKGEKDNKETIQYKDLETNFDEECKVSEEELKPRIENPKIRKLRKQKERE